VIPTELARQALPPWVPWMPLLAWGAASAVTTALVGGVVARLSERGVTRTLHEPWPEHARAAWIARRNTVLALLGACPAAGVFAPLFAGPASAVDGKILAGVAATASILVAMGVRARQERRLWPLPLRTAEALRGGVSFLVVLLGHLLAVAIIALLAPASGAVALGLLWLVALGITLLWTRGVGLILGQALGLVRPAPPRLLAIVEQARLQAGVEVRQVAVLRWHKLNAFAFPAGGRLGFTDGALALLRDEELADICAHELGHLGEARKVVLARSLASAAFTPLVFAHAALAHGGVGGWLALTLPVLAILVVAGRLSRRMEERADEAGHAHAGLDPTSYARTLEQVYRLNQVPPVLGGRRAHPDLVDRMAAAGLKPTWSLPAPPPRRASLAIGAAVVVLVSLLAGSLRLGSAWAANALHWRAPTAALALRSSYGLDRQALTALRDRAVGHGDSAQARALNSLVLSDAPREPGGWLAEVRLAGAQGDCPSAAEALATAARLSPEAVGSAEAWPPWPALGWSCPGVEPTPVPAGR